MLARESLPNTTVSTDETEWGYIIRCRDRGLSLKVANQAFAATLGILCFIVAIGLWVLPGSVTSVDVNGIKLAISALTGVFGMTLIWFASHGTRDEFQVNLVRAELREVLRDTRGRAQVQSRTKFADVEAVFIDGTPMKNGKKRLLVQTGNPMQLIEVARDHEEYLIRICARLKRDILDQDASGAPASK